MKTIELKASLRTAKGNSPCRALRREGLIPAVLYGPGAEPTMLSVSRKELSDIIRKTGRQVMFNLQIDAQGAKPRIAMIKELQADVRNQKYLHADFYEIDMNRKIHAMVPVATTGKCKGVEDGGMLQVIRRELEVVCLPGDVPEQIVIDVTDLEMGEAVHLSHVAKPDTVAFPDSVDFTVVTVVAPGGGTAGEGGAEEEEGAEGEVAE